MLSPHSCPLKSDPRQATLNLRGMLGGTVSVGCGNGTAWRDARVAPLQRSPNPCRKKCLMNETGLLPLTCNPVRHQSSRTLNKIDSAYAAGQPLMFRGNNLSYHD